MESMHYLTSAALAGRIAACRRFLATHLRQGPQSPWPHCCSEEHAQFEAGNHRQEGHLAFQRPILLAALLHVKSFRVVLYCKEP